MTNQPETAVTVDALARMLSAADVEINHGDYPTWDTLAESGQKQYRQAARYLLKRLHITAPAAVSAAVAPPTNQTTTGASETPRQWCKCPSCWGWFVEEHPGEDLDELGTDLSWWSGLPEHRNAPDSELRRMADETATTETPFTPPAHYRRDDGVECCVHAIPVGPNSCPACRELADDEPAAGPAIVDQVVAALQAKAQALSVEAEEEMRRDLEEQAQVWHEAADLARRTGRKAARSTQPAAGARQDGATQ